MRVPADPANPTYERTFNVPFGRWLRSSAAERKEWTRRRNAALKVQHRQGLQHNRERAERFSQRVGDAMPVGRPRPTPAPRDPQTAALHQWAKSTNRWARIEQWLLGVELAILLIPVALCLLGVAALGVWYAMYR